MKAQVRTLAGEIAHEIDLPEIFDEEYRPDLIKRAVLALQSTRFQPHGTDPRASAPRQSPGAAGEASLRSPLKTRSRVASVPQATAACSPSPKVAKVLVKEINRKRKQKALRSAIAASTSPELVRGRGYSSRATSRWSLEDRFEEVTGRPTSSRRSSALGVYADVERAKGSRRFARGAHHARPPPASSARAS